eukprot:3577796-Pyramimonas_sp.AAC.1
MNRVCRRTAVKMRPSLRISLATSSARCCAIASLPGCRCTNHRQCLLIRPKSRSSSLGIIRS